MSKADPYHDRKIYHFGCAVNEEGDMVALCYNRPRTIDLKIATWTIRPEAVTCPKCQKRLAATTPLEV